MTSALFSLFSIFVIALCAAWFPLAVADAITASAYDGHTFQDSEVVNVTSNDRWLFQNCTFLGNLTFVFADLYVDNVSITVDDSTFPVVVTSDGGNSLWNRISFVFASGDARLSASTITINNIQSTATSPKNAASIAYTENEPQFGLITFSTAATTTSTSPSATIGSGTTVTITNILIQDRRNIAAVLWHQMRIDGGGADLQGTVVKYDNISSTVLNSFGADLSNVFGVVYRSGTMITGSAARVTHTNFYINGNLTGTTDLVKITAAAVLYYNSISITVGATVSHSQLMVYTASLLGSVSSQCVSYMKQISITDRASVSHDHLDVASLGKTQSLACAVYFQNDILISVTDPLAGAPYLSYSMIRANAVNVVKNSMTADSVGVQYFSNVSILGGAVITHSDFNTTSGGTTTCASYTSNVNIGEGAMIIHERFVASSPVNSATLIRYFFTIRIFGSGTIVRHDTMAAVGGFMARGVIMSDDVVISAGAAIGTDGLSVTVSPSKQAGTEASGVWYQQVTITAAAIRHSGISVLHEAAGGTANGVMFLGNVSFADGAEVIHSTIGTRVQSAIVACGVNYQGSYLSIAGPQTRVRHVGIEVFGPDAAYAVAYRNSADLSILDGATVSHDELTATVVAPAAGGSVYSSFACGAYFMRFPRLSGPATTLTFDGVAARATNRNSFGVFYYQPITVSGGVSMVHSNIIALAFTTELDNQKVYAASLVQIGNTMTLSDNSQFIIRNSGGGGSYIPPAEAVECARSIDADYITLYSGSQLLIANVIDVDRVAIGISTGQGASMVEIDNITLSSGAAGVHRVPATLPALANGIAFSGLTYDDTYILVQRSRFGVAAGGNQSAITFVRNMLSGTNYVSIMQNDFVVAGSDSSAAVPADPPVVVSLPPSLLFDGVLEIIANNFSRGNVSIDVGGTNALLVANVGEIAPTIASSSSGVASVGCDGWVAPLPASPFITPLQCGAKITRCDPLLPFFDKTTVPRVEAVLSTLENGAWPMPYVSCLQPPATDAPTASTPSTTDAPTTTADTPAPDTTTVQPDPATSTAATETTSRAPTTMSTTTAFPIHNGATGEFLVGSELDSAELLRAIHSYLGTAGGEHGSITQLGGCKAVSDTDPSSNQTCKVAFGDVTDADVTVAAANAQEMPGVFSGAIVTPQTTTPTNKQDDDSSSNGGKIAGGVIGAVLAVAAIVGAVVFWRSRRRESVEGLDRLMESDTETQKINYV